MGNATQFFRTEILKLTVLSLLNTKYFILKLLFCDNWQFFENCKDGNDMGRLEVLMCLEIQFFLVIVIVYLFEGLILLLVNPFVPNV